MNPRPLPHCGWPRASVATTCVSLAALGALWACASRTTSTGNTPNTGAKLAANNVASPPARAWALPHDTCRAVGAAGLGRAFDECVKILGQTDAFSRHGLALCALQAQRAAPRGHPGAKGERQAVQGATGADGASADDARLAAANVALDCLRGVSNAAVSAESARGCAKLQDAARTKTNEGRCVNGQVDPFDCLEPLGQCLRTASERVVTEDVVPAAAAGASLEPFFAAVRASDIAAARTLVEAVGSVDGGALESRPPLSDLSGVAAGYGPGTEPLALPQPLSKVLAEADPLRTRAHFLEPDAVAFCAREAPTEDCARAIVNFEFSSADLALCGQVAAKGREVACLYAVRQVHKKGHVRRSKLQAEAFGALGLLESGEGVAARTALERLKVRLDTVYVR